MSQTPDSSSVIVTATPEELERAFDEWLHKYEEDPSSFEDYEAPGADNSSYGRNCTYYLIEILGELREDNSDAADV